MYVVRFEILSKSKFFRNLVWINRSFRFWSFQTNRRAEIHKLKQWVKVRPNCVLKNRPKIRIILGKSQRVSFWHIVLIFNYAGIFRSNCLFIGSNLREAVNDGRADFMPVFLSEIPLLFRRNILNIDVALVHVSPPDEHGFCSLGPSVDIAVSAIQNAKYIIGKNYILLAVCKYDHDDLSAYN